MNTMHRLGRMLALLLFIGGWGLLHAGCGGGAALQEDEVRACVKGLAQALIDKDRDAVANQVDNFNAIGASNQAWAKKWETPDGRKEVIESHYRALKMILNDAGILEYSDIDRLMANLTVHTGSRMAATASFEIAANKEKKLSAEKVTLTVAKGTDGNMRVTGYGREIAK